MMRWFEVTVTTSLEMVDWIADVFHANGADGVAIEDGEVLNRTFDSPYGEMNGLNPDDYPAEGARIKGYVHEGIDLGELEDELKDTLNRWAAEGTRVGEATVVSREVTETDWATAWQAYYHPVKVSQRIGIAPTWEPFADGEAPEIVIALDPGMAFGTGTHATTTLCIQALERVIQGGERVADIGTGTAILSIAAVRLGAAHVMALDLDPVAVESAHRNCEENQVTSQVTVVQNELGVPLTEYVSTADITVANILAEVIVALASELSALTRPGGKGIFSGIIAPKQALVEQALTAQGWTIDRAEAEGDWVVLEATYQRT